MSTAIALQDIRSHAQENGVTRHSSKSKTDTTEEEDDWLSTSQDVDSSTTPLDGQPFHPKSTYWISPHGMLSKSIQILDLTKDMDVPYTGLTPVYKDAVKKTLKDHPFTPAYTCHRSNWLGLKYNITSSREDDEQPIAEWKHLWSSVGEATLYFPSDSPYSSHPISLRNRHWGLRTEAFTYNSVLYIWEMDSLWHSTNMTLSKVFGSGENEKRVVVAKYAQKWWGGFVTGGTVVVDERDVSGCVVCLTLCVVLKKKRQRAAERNGGGGGGGGGS